MAAYELDHVVLWVADPVRSARFYQEVLGLEPLRLTEFTVGEASFVRMRVSPGTVIDLTPLSVAPTLNAVPGVAGTAGHLVNHVCLAMAEEEFEALRGRLEAGGHRVTPDQRDSYGAR